MGFLFVALPTIGWGWPALVPIAGAVAAGLGYKTFSDPKGALRGRVTRKLESIRREVVALDEVIAEIMAEEVGAEERLMFEKDDFILIFRKDARGKFFIEVSGPREKPALDLRIRAEEFAKELAKKFAYNRLVQQLEKTNAFVIEEEVSEGGRITLKGRKWR